MNQSEKIGEIAAALAKAQSQFTAAQKDGDNTHFRSNYATIESVLESVVPALNANGIAVIQRPMAKDEFQGAQLETMLVHSSGEWISSLIKIPSGKNDAHGYGSAYTYARRYALAAMCGIKQTDDDGNGAAEQGKPSKDAPKVNALRDLLKGFPDSIKDGFEWHKKTNHATMKDATYIENVAKVIKANQSDPEAISGYLKEKGWLGTAMASDMARESMP